MLDVWGERLRMELTRNRKRERARTMFKRALREVMQALGMAEEDT